MKRKYAYILSLLLLAFVFTSCKKADEIDPVFESSVMTSMEKTMTALDEMGDMNPDKLKEREEYIDYLVSNNQIEENNAEVQKALLNDWAEIEPDVGKLMDFSDFSLTRAGKTYTATLTAEFEKRRVNLIYVIEADDLSITAMNVEKVYTFGEKMQKAGLNTLMGILIVFSMLVLMSICIYAFNIIPYLMDKFGKKDESAPSIEIAERKLPESVVAPGAADYELVAVIAAAIAASEQISTDDFIVRSIRKR